jgi:hypothetical protein
MRSKRGVNRGANIEISESGAAVADSMEQMIAVAVSA